MSRHNTPESRREAGRRREERARINKIWLWIGVLVLCAILLFWLFDIGTFMGPSQ